MAKFFDDKVIPTPPEEAGEDRYDLLSLKSAEPNLGLPETSGYVLASDTEGNRYWVAISSADGDWIPKSIILAKGDTIVGLSSGNPVKLPVGSDGQVLTADSSASYGVKWGDVPLGDFIPNAIITAKGDLIIGEASNDPNKLAVGTNGYVLTADSTAPLGIKWASPAGDFIPNSVISAKGDLIIGEAASDPNKLPVGTNGHVLTADASAPLGVTWAPTASPLNLTTVTKTATSLAPGAAYDFTISGSCFLFVRINANQPAWIRGYGTSAARSADIRTLPGAPYPDPGTGFFTEVVTTALEPEISLSPLPTIYGDSSTTYWRVINQDTLTRTITMVFSIVTLID